MLIEPQRISAETQALKSALPGQNQFIQPPGQDALGVKMPFCGIPSGNVNNLKLARIKILIEIIEGFGQSRLGLVSVEGIADYPHAIFMLTQSGVKVRNQNIEQVLLCVVK